MTKPQDKIVGIGLAAVDFLGVVDRLPANSMALMGTLTIQGGGNVATALVTLAQLGRKVAFLGKISDDMFGDHIRSELEQAGVDLSGLVIGYVYLRGWGHFRRLHRRYLEWKLKRLKKKFRVIDGGNDPDKPPYIH